MKLSLRFVDSIGSLLNNAVVTIWQEPDYNLYLCNEGLTVFHTFLHNLYTLTHGLGISVLTSDYIWHVLNILQSNITLVYSVLISSFSYFT
jgi:hypothetical protein